MRSGLVSSTLGQDTSINGIMTANKLLAIRFREGDVERFEKCSYVSLKHIDKQGSISFNRLFHSVKDSLNVNIDQLRSCTKALKELGLIKVWHMDSENNVVRLYAKHTEYKETWCDTMEAKFPELKAI